MAERRANLRKRRTREHVIADLSVNHVERQVLLHGAAVERVRNDYGIDVEILFFDDDGYWKNGRAMLQIKATDRPTVRAGGTSVAVRVDARDLRFWRLVSDPVILVAYDAAEDRAHWLHVQPLLRGTSGTALLAPASTTLHVPRANRLTAEAVREFERLSDAQVGRWFGMMDHHGRD